MRKVLVFVLALAMILGSFSFAFAAEDNGTYSDVAGTDCEGAVTVLSALGVVNGYADGTYKPEGIVTRAEMAKLLIVALGMEDYVGGAYANYNDVPGSHWATSYIAYAASMGIIEGYPDGNFKPDATVTYQEAVTMIVRALGYQDQYLTGTWPASHVSMAKALGILDDIVATADGANRGDVALMLYNALTLPTVTYTTTGTVNDNGKSMMERLDALKGDAKVLGPNAGDVDVTVGGTTKTYNNVEISDAVDLSAYYGFNVVPYIMQNDDDDWEVIAVGEIKGTAYEVELTAAGFDYNDTSYTFAAGASVFVNNQDAVVGDLISATDDAASMATVVVSGSLSKTSANTLFSITQWQVNEAVYVSEDDNDLVSVIADGIEDSTNIDLGSYNVIYDDDAEVFDVTVEGAATDLAGIKENDVLFVYARSTQTTAGTDVEKIVVARDVVEGTVSKVNSGGTKFTVDGKAYEKSDYDATDSYLAATDFAVALDADEVGNDWTLYLDPNGCIFFAEATDSMGDYAVIVAAAVDTDVYGKTTDVLKVMDKTGAVVELNLKGTGEPTDVTYTNVTDSTTNGLFDELISGDIITYSTNSDGKITAIEKYTRVPATAAMTKAGVFNNKHASADTVFFTYEKTVPADVTEALSEDEDDFELGAYAKVAGEKNPFPAQYVLDGDDIVAMIVGDKVGGTTNTFGVINSYSSVKNSDDKAVYEYDALIDGKAVTDLLTDGTGSPYNVTSAAGVADKTKDFASLYIIETDATGVVTGLTLVDKDSTFAADDIVALTLDSSSPQKVCFQQVTGIDKTAGWVQLNDADMPSFGKEVTVYKMTFDDDDAFDSYVLGGMNDITKGAWLVGFDTTDDDEVTVDLVLVVTRSDYNDYATSASLGF